MQAVQNAVRSYIRNEWIYWVMAIVIAMFVLILSAPVSYAKPVLQKTVDTVQFYQDTEEMTWYMRYHEHITDMEENFSSIKVIWHGTYSNTPLVLIAGDDGAKCPMNFQLYWFLSSGEVRQAKNFGVCNAKNVKVDIDGQYVVISFDGMIKRVPLM